jgi:photosystem II stability/assembly factor-like uncharacterized protein
LLPRWRFRFDWQSQPQEPSRVLGLAFDVPKQYRINPVSRNSEQKVLMTKIDDSNARHTSSHLQRLLFGNRKVSVILLSALGATVLTATISVGAVNVLSGPTSKNDASAVNTIRWVVPHDQGGAPVVPTSGGATNGNGSFNAVSCPSATECVAVGGDGSLGGVASTSHNGGLVWNQGEMDANEPLLNAVDCANTSVCVAVGQGATVRSTNGGSTWTSSTIPTSDTTLLGVSCASVTTCVAVGVSPGNAAPFNGQLLISSNGGTSWTVPTLPASFGALGSVDCPTSTFCVSVGSSIIVSNDGGKTWTQRTVDGGSGVLRSVSCLSATRCVAIGANPAIAQDPNASAYEDVWVDGGVTWSSVALPSGSAMLDVVSCSSSGCDAAGSAYNGTPAVVLVTSGGNTWTTTQGLSDSATAFSSLSCSSTSTCVFVGQNGKNPVAVSTVNGVTTSSGPVSAQVRTQKDVTR